MEKARLADTPGTIARIQGAAMPLLGHDFLGDTEVAPPWLQVAHDAYCPPMNHHIIGAVFHGDGITSVKQGAKLHLVRSRSGTSIINPRGNDGWWRCSGTPLVSNVFVGEKRLQRCLDEVGRGGSPELLLNLQIEDRRLFTILSLIAEEKTPEDSIAKLYVEHLVDALCLHVLREHSAFPMVAEVFRGGLTPAQVKRVSQYMQDHLSDDLRLQDLADLVGRSRFHFCRAFRRSTGYTPHQWLMRLRMGEARRLLASTRLSITEVALATGYQTPSAFSQAFRQAVGVTPRNFRQLL